VCYDLWYAIVLLKPGNGMTSLKGRTKYVDAGGVYIAYQVIGSGPHDLIIIPGFISHLEHMWEEPGIVRFFERLASFSRVIVFDKRGTGLSDRGSKAPTLEERMEDVKAVMGAVHSKRAALFGASEGGPMSILFAATYPEQTTALIIYGSYAKGAWAEDYPWMLTADQYEKWIKRIPRTWGDPESFRYWAPSAADDALSSEWWGKLQRLGASPGAVIDLIRLYSEIDVRPVLGCVQVPTLVLHRRDDRTIRVGAGRYLGQHIPKAKYVELEGVDHLWWVKDNGEITAEIEDFLTGARPPMLIERTLSTVVFTDIVDSTGQAQAAGDEAWLKSMDRHDQLMRQEITNFQGREIRSTGDGFLITFDGPSRAILFAEKIRRTLAEMGLAIRAGIHTGEVELSGHDLGGIGVHIAARVLDQAKGSTILVSSTVKDLVVGSGIEFEDRGSYQLKGVSGGWRLYEVVATPPAYSRR
jgi:class 3 adenylate cyclase/pimeloyl-ACP methyl ester carboxylesterase